MSEYAYPTNIGLRITVYQRVVLEFAILGESAGVVQQPNLLMCLILNMAVLICLLLQKES